MMSIVEKYSSEMLSELHVKRLLCIRKASSLSEDMQFQNALGTIEEIEEENDTVTSKGVIKAASASKGTIKGDNAVIKSLSTKDSGPNTEHQSRMTRKMTWKTKSNVDDGAPVSNVKRFDTGKKIIKKCHPMCTCEGQFENTFKHSSDSRLNKRLSVSELMAFADRVTTLSTDLFPQISKEIPGSNISTCSKIKELIKNITK
jgi:hypothetical protein